MSKQSKEKVLKELFEDPETGLQSQRKLLKKAKLIDPSITLSDVTKFLSKQETAQLNKQEKKGDFNPIVARKVNGVWQADLLDMRKWSKFNGGIKWILTIVDVYSRRAWAFPLKSKSTKNTAEALRNLFKKTKLPTNLTTDNGKEFIGNEFQVVLKDHDVKHWTHEPGSHNTLGIIERFNRTLRQLIRKWLTLKKTKKYSNVLDKLVSNYNTSFHETIQSEPMTVYSGKQTFSNEKRKIRNVRVFKVGDRIRLSIKRKTFEKSTELEAF